MKLYILTAASITIVCAMQNGVAQINEGGLDQGKAIYRSNCAFCHGLTAEGGRGPNLMSSNLLHSAPDETITNIITRGVPGSTMPAFDLPKDDLSALLQFLRSLSGSGATNVKVPGDVKAGEAVYSRSGCANCHRIGNIGSIYAPDLTRMGAGRSIEYIRESIVDPSADIPDGYGGVTVVMKDGRRVSGVRVNEDTFTVQIRKPDQGFALFDKSETKEVIHETKSMMPSYSHLSATDLQNLLAYLETLRGEPASGGEANKAEGIH
jgi:cytochrome c oxidase cbb3-type subunit 3